MTTGNALIAQGGGPTAVINQSLVGAIIEARRHGAIKQLYGARHGVRGIVGEDLCDLARVTTAELERVARSPAAALLSTRDKPDDAYCESILRMFKKYDVRYFFYIGGNDSADTCHILSVFAQHSGYDLVILHIPKTIDNDLLVTDHCPGYGSAARFVASAFAGLALDTRALSGVYIGVVMGRHAGFLTAASALARRFEDDGPHLIYLPERPFDREQYVTQVEETVTRYGRCLVAVSEGIVDASGEPLTASLLPSEERDAHGNVQLSGTGALGDALREWIQSALHIRRVRCDTFGYLLRSFLGVVSPIDAVEAREVGAHAVRFAVGTGESGSVSIDRVGDYAVAYSLQPLTAVAGKTKQVPDAFIGDDGATITPSFLDYAKPLVGALPVYDHLPFHPVVKR